MKKLLKISIFTLFISLFFINNSFASQNFCDKEIYNYELNQNSLKDSNFLKNINLNDENFKKDLLKYYKECRIRYFMDYANGNFLFTFSFYNNLNGKEETIGVINDKVIFKKDLVLPSYLSKYGNHIISFYAPEDLEEWDDESANKIKDKTGFFIDGVKYSGFLKGKNDYNYELIKSQNHANLVYNYDYLNGYLTTENEYRDRRDNGENLILNKKDLKKIDFALENFLSKKENILKIDEVIQKAQEIKLKTSKFETKKIEILNYIQAELKIFQIKNKN